MGEHLTFVVPTLGGHQRILIICKWLQWQRFSGRLIIVASDDINPATYFIEFDFVTCVHAPKTNVLQAMAIGFQRVTTSYCSYLGDDDLPNIKSFQKCCQFLEGNLTFGAARGACGFVEFQPLQRVFVSKKKPSLAFYTKTLLSDRYDAPSDLSHRQAQSRVNSLYSNYIVAQFFVTRTEIAKNLWSEAWAKIPDPYLAERVWSLSHAALVRTKFISCHYLLRGLGVHRPAQKKFGEEKRSNDSWKLFVPEVEEAFSHLNLDAATTQLLVELATNPLGRNKATRNQKSSERWARFKRLPRRFLFIIKFQLFFSIKFLWWLWLIDMMPEKK